MGRPSASAADGFEKIKNTLKLLIQSILLLFALQLIANVQTRNYSEDKLQCFLSLVSKGLETNKFQSLITIENEKMTKDSESYENFSLAANETNVDRKISDEWSKIDPDWNVAACGKGQAITQRRLQTELFNHLSKNEGKDGLDKGKTLQTNHSAYLCHGRAVRGSARRVFDPGGHGKSLQNYWELPTIETDAGSKSKAWSAWQTAWWANLGVGSPNSARVSKLARRSWSAKTARWATFFGTCFLEKALNLASCISWQQRCCR